MQEAGKVLNFSKNKNLVLEASTPLELQAAVRLLGRELVTEKFERAGKVVDVFGPARHPYLSVKPLGAASGELLGKKLFLKTEKV